LEVLPFFLIALSGLDAKPKWAWLFFVAKANSFTPTHKKSAKSSVNSNLSVPVPEPLSQYIVSIWGFERIASNFLKSFLRNQNCLGFKKTKENKQKKIPDTAASF